MTRRTAKCIGLALLVLLSTSVVALAGTFEGQGREDPRVGISFEKKGGEIRRFTIERATFLCTNGERFRAGMRAGNMALTRRDRFHGRFTDSDGKVVLRIEGRVVGRKARGTLRVVVYVKSYKCTTGPVEWKARATRR